MEYTEEDKKLVSYDPKTGIVTNAKTGRPIKKHAKIIIDGKNFNVLSLIWYCMTDEELPPKMVVRKNKKAFDNRWENLEKRTPSATPVKKHSKPEKPSTKSPLVKDKSLVDNCFNLLVKECLEEETRHERVVGLLKIILSKISKNELDYMIARGYCV